MAYAHNYDEKTCITAGELRGIGVELPKHVPDCAWISRENVRLVFVNEDDGKGVASFKWINPKNTEMVNTGTDEHPFWVPASAYLHAIAEATLRPTHP